MSVPRSIHTAKPYVRNASLFNSMKCLCTQVEEDDISPLVWIWCLSIDIYRVFYRVIHTAIQSVLQVILLYRVFYRVIATALYFTYGLAVTENSNCMTTS